MKNKRWFAVWILFFLSVSIFAINSFINVGWRTGLLSADIFSFRFMLGGLFFLIFLPFSIFVLTYLYKTEVKEVKV